MPLWGPRSQFGEIVQNRWERIGYNVSCTTDGRELTAAFRAGVHGRWYVGSLTSIET